MGLSLSACYWLHSRTQARPGFWREEQPPASSNGQQHPSRQFSQASDASEGLPAQSSPKRSRQDSSSDPEQPSSSQPTSCDVDGQPDGQAQGSQERTVQTAEQLRELKAARQAEAQRRAADLQREAFLQQSRIAAQKAAIRALENKSTAAARAAVEATQAQKADAARRKARLDAGFAEAFRVAEEAAAAAAASTQKSIAADASEVARVLAAKSHWDCLQLPLNSTRDALKRKYRAMAVALHPDKCKVDGATDAFQRLVQAYQALLPQLH
ncbi:hypothetical protein WJX73_002604 [Symbiochloris irregularis]|uniref:J domain-containing protein n=1 Tax=Symbiochloris irregularis TaxID=706552 RepID=A0AAW1PKD6_9CHLO